MNLGEKMSLPQIILLVYVFCVVVILPAATRQAIRDYKAKRARTSTSEPKVSQIDAFIARLAWEYVLVLLWPLVIPFGWALRLSRRYR